MVRAVIFSPVSKSRLTLVPVIQELLIYSCKTEAGPTASCGCLCVQDTKIPGVSLWSGFAMGRQSQGSVRAWQRGDRGTSSCSPPAGLVCVRERDCTGYEVLCTQKVTLPASVYIDWCVSFGVY